MTMCLLLEPEEIIVCKEVFTEEDEITEEEIAQYAAKLRIDYWKEKHLVALAKEFLQQPLPPDWIPCYDRSHNRYFYFNSKTGVSQWEHPLDDSYKLLVEELRNQSDSIDNYDFESMNTDKMLRLRQNRRPQLMPIDQLLKKNRKKRATSAGGPQKHDDFRNSMFAEGQLKNSKKSVRFSLNEPTSVADGLISTDFHKTTDEVKRFDSRWADDTVEGSKIPSTVHIDINSLTEADNENKTTLNAASLDTLIHRPANIKRSSPIAVWSKGERGKQVRRVSDSAFISGSNMDDTSKMILSDLPSSDESLEQESDVSGKDINHGDITNRELFRRVQKQLQDSDDRVVNLYQTAEALERTEIDDTTKIFKEPRKEVKYNLRKPDGRERPEKREGNYLQDVNAIKNSFLEEIENMETRIDSNINKRINDCIRKVQEFTEERLKVCNSAMENLVSARKSESEHSSDIKNEIITMKKEIVDVKERFVKDEIKKIEDSISQKMEDIRNEVMRKVEEIKSREKITFDSWENFQKVHTTNLDTVKQSLLLTVDQKIKEAVSTQVPSAVCEMFTSEESMNTRGVRNYIQKLVDAAIEKKTEPIKKNVYVQADENQITDQGQGLNQKMDDILVAVEKTQQKINFLCKSQEKAQNEEKDLKLRFLSLEDKFSQLVNVTDIATSDLYSNSNRYFGAYSGNMFIKNNLNPVSNWKHELVKYQLGSILKKSVL